MDTTTPATDLTTIAAMPIDHIACDHTDMVDDADLVAITLTHMDPSWDDEETRDAIVEAWITHGFGFGQEGSTVGQVASRIAQHIVDSWS